MHDLDRGDLIASDQSGAEAAGLVKVLARRPLRGGDLPVAHRAVVVATVAGDMVPGVLFLDAAAALADHDHDRDLGLVVQAARLGRTQDVLAMRHLRLGQAQEDRGRFGDFLAGLAHMLAVVQADAEDLARVGYHGQQFELRELQRRLVLAGGFCDGAEKVLGNQGLEVLCLGAEDGVRLG